MKRHIFALGLLVTFLLLFITAHAVPLPGTQANASGGGQGIQDATDPSLNDDAAGDAVVDDQGQELGTGVGLPVDQVSPGADGAMDQVPDETNQGRDGGNMNGSGGNGRPGDSFASPPENARDNGTRQGQDGNGQDGNQNRGGRNANDQQNQMVQLINDLERERDDLGRSINDLRRIRDQGQFGTSERLEISRETRDALNQVDNMRNRLVDLDTASRNGGNRNDNNANRNQQ